MSGKSEGRIRDEQIYARFDYDRFLRSAGDHEKVLGRIAARLLAEKRISQAERDAIVGNARRVMEGAYMAGRCEPPGVEDVDAELAKLSKVSP